MKENPFQQPDYGSDEKKLAEESQKTGSRDWSEIYWKVQKGDENLIRILPAIAGGGADYHLTYSIHFIKHQDRVERFICARETYGKPCPACEQFFVLVKDKDTKKEAHERYGVKRLGLFNIIDRSAVEPKVMLYECPQTAVWKAVLTLARVLKKQKASLFDVYDEKGALETPGRDILITFNPEAEGVAMYSLMAAPTPEPLGTDEQIKAWSEQITPLVLEEIAPITDYEIAKIKTFGDRVERDELRTQVAAEFAAEREEAEKAEEKPKEKEKEKEAEKPVEKAKEAEAKKEEEKPKEKEKEEEKPKEEEKKKEEEKPKDETPDDVKEKIKRIREKAQQQNK